MLVLASLLVAALPASASAVEAIPTSEPGAALGQCIGESGSVYEVVVCRTYDTFCHIFFGQHCLHPPG